VSTASARTQVDRVAAPRRAVLRPVTSAPRQPALRRLLTGRALTALSIVLVVGALMAVVVGQAMLANGQVRMAAIAHDLSLEQSAHRQIELSDSALETPTRIVAAATGLHMVHSAVIELPYVSLTTPLPTPTVTAPPASTTATTTATTTAASATTTSTASSGSATTTSTP
jgi:hypothetical protein